jgi:hypothetical protein
MAIRKDILYQVLTGIVGVIFVILMGLFALTGEYPRPSYINGNGDVTISETPTLIPTFVPTQPAYPEPIASPIVTEIP